MQCVHVNAQKMAQGKQKGNKHFLKCYLEDMRILLDDGCYLLNPKCYQSMRKAKTVFIVPNFKSDQ